MGDVSHFWSDDLQLGPDGDLLIADPVTASEQSLLRRFFTAPGEYLWHPDYGAGIQIDIGKPLDIRALKAKFLSQMTLDTSVSKSPPPKVDVKPVPGGASVQISYVVADTGTAVVLSYSIRG